MRDALGGNPAVNQHLEAPPVQAGFLTAEAQLPPPQPDDPPPEGAQGPHVPRHGVVVEVTLHDRPEPLAGLGNRLMAPLAELLMHRFQLRDHALARRLAADREGARLSVPLANMREAQKVERVRLAFAPLLPVCDGVWPKLDQACLLRVEFQPELVQAVLQRCQEPLCLTSVLEAEHKVIGKADDHHVPLRDTFAPGLHPQVEDIVQIAVGQQRAHYTSYKVAKNVVEFSTSIPRKQLHPSYGAGFLGAPLTMVKPDDIPRERE
jgi:hypothetical protein